MKTLIIIALFVLTNASTKEVITPKSQIEIDGEIHKQNLIESVEEFLKILELDSDTLYVPFE